MLVPFLAVTTGSGLYLAAMVAYRRRRGGSWSTWRAASWLGWDRPGRDRPVPRPRHRGARGTRPHGAAPAARDARAPGAGDGCSRLPAPGRDASARGAEGHGAAAEPGGPRARAPRRHGDAARGRLVRALPDAAVRRLDQRRRGAPPRAPPLPGRRLPVRLVDRRTGPGSPASRDRGAGRGPGAGRGGPRLPGQAAVRTGGRAAAWRRPRRRRRCRPRRSGCTTAATSPSSCSPSPCSRRGTGTPVDLAPARCSRQREEELLHLLDVDAVHTVAGGQALLQTRWRRLRIRRGPAPGTRPRAA